MSVSRIEGLLRAWALVLAAFPEILSDLTLYYDRLREARDATKPAPLPALDALAMPLAAEAGRLAAHAEALLAIATSLRAYASDASPHAARMYEESRTYAEQRMRRKDGRWIP